MQAQPSVTTTFRQRTIIPAPGATPEIDTGSEPDDDANRRAHERAADETGELLVALAAAYVIVGLLRVAETLDGAADRLRGFVLEPVSGSDPRRVRRFERFAVARLRRAWMRIW